MGNLRSGNANPNSGFFQIQRRQNRDTNLYRYVDDNSTNLTDPTGLKLYKEKDEPNDIIFMDEAYWKVVSDQRDGGSIFSPPQAILKTNNKAADVMIKWRRIKSNDFSLNVYYITDAENGPLQFARDAAKKGAGSINLFFGHGAGDSQSIAMAVKMALSSVQKGNQRPLFGMGCCYATLYNHATPDNNLLSVTPDNDGACSLYQTPTLWSPMILEVDRIIHQRLGKTEVKLNVYFGEFEKREETRGLIAGNTFMYGKSPKYRYRQWKW